MEKMIPGPKDIVETPLNTPFFFAKFATIFPADFASKKFEGKICKKIRMKVPFSNEFSQKMIFRLLVTAANKQHINSKQNPQEIPKQNPQENGCLGVFLLYSGSRIIIV